VLIWRRFVGSDTFGVDTVQQKTKLLHLDQAIFISLAHHLDLLVSLLFCCLLLLLLLLY
jgi:hypothetical protein